VRLWKLAFFELARLVPLLEGTVAEEAAQVEVDDSHVGVVGGEQLSESGVEGDVGRRRQQQQEDVGLWVQKGGRLDGARLTRAQSANSANPSARRLHEEEGWPQSISPIQHRRRLFKKSDRAAKFSIWTKNTLRIYRLVIIFSAKNAFFSIFNQIIELKFLKFLFFHLF